MACSPMLFVLRARQHFGAADLRKYLGEAKVYPAHAADIVAGMVARIQAEREVTVTRDEYERMWALEAQLSQPAPVEVVEQPTPVEVVEQPIPVDVGWNSELATELFGKVEVVG